MKITSRPQSNRVELSTAFCYDVPLDILELLSEQTTLDGVMREGSKLEHELNVTRNKLYHEVESSIVTANMMHYLMQDKQDLEYKVEMLLNTIDGLTENIKNLEGN